MRGYVSSSYGDGFADVYDDWYGDVSDVAATVARLHSLVGAAGTVLELGVGTGRLAIPMAEAGLVVTGIDSSTAMVDKLRARASAHDVAMPVVVGDMVEDLPLGPFDGVLVAYNTIFNLLDAEAQADCFAAVSARLAPGGCFVVEAFVPDTDAAAGSEVTVRSMTVDRVVLAVTQHDPAAQRASGQFVDITETGGVTLRPWSVRWSTPEQLDGMAESAGLTLITRTEDMAGKEFTDESKAHVTVYRKP